MRYHDWGSRSDRWAGIHSENIDVHGTTVHYLSTEAERPTGTPVHLLIGNPAASAIFWLDVMPELRRYGRVIAVDLPGAFIGRTDSPGRRAARIEPSAQFLQAFTDTLGLDRVLLHASSAGAMVALLFAGIAPERLAGLVLSAPAMPPPLSTGEQRGWRTAGRVGLAVVPPIARAILRVSGKKLIDRKLRFLADPGSFENSRWDLGGGDLTRISAELAELIRDELRTVRPRQLSSGITMFASTFTTMFVERRPVQEAMRDITAPTLVLWGDDDHLIPRGWIDDWSARRPDWTLTVIEGAGHALQLEVPTAYVRAVGNWLSPTGN